MGTEQGSPASQAPSPASSTWGHLLISVRLEHVKKGQEECGSDHEPRRLWATPTSIPEADGIQGQEGVGGRVWGSRPEGASVSPAQE